MMIRFRLGGRDHIRGDRNCPGCESIAGQLHPRLHKEYSGSNCPGLVHAEKFEATANQVNQTVVWCDACYQNPIRRELRDSLA